ncbi:hypothetical protein KQI61_05695 [Anaerocolumna aminovalerica]|uniref:hypothetical protein n=1 Tax=Anaerocolumna aminovalerica TaxID=1527 RepID=UPI001C0EA50F|nr:hypothetical protein [Anaerocolumna aminovalerica]MBU5331683.1 hypothetical protein [Anaerocolumna aminovalerica]
MNKEDFCFPRDFFYINKDILKNQFEIQKALTIIALILWTIQGFLCMVGYYITLPFILLHKLCENRCYY